MLVFRPLYWLATASLFLSQYEDALESPLEQCISDSMLRSKDSGLPTLDNLFSLVPSGVPTNKPSSQTISEEPAPLPISSPDSFSDFFKVVGQFKLNVMQ